MREEVGLSGCEEEAGVEAAVGDEVDGVGVLDADESGHGRSPEGGAICEGEVACQESCRQIFENVADCSQKGSFWPNQMKRGLRRVQGGSDRDCESNGQGQPGGSG